MKKGEKNLACNKPRNKENKRSTEDHSEVPAVLHVGKENLDLAKAIRMSATRREFIKAGLAAGVGATGMLGGLETVLAKVNRDDNKKDRPVGIAKRNLEVRDFVFDCSSFDTDNHRLMLIAGSNRTKIHPMNNGRWNKLCRKHPILKRVPRERATHFVRVSMPADGLQLCYVKRYVKGVNDGSWSMAHMFFHHPISALTESMQMVKARFGANYPVPAKWENFGVSADEILAHNDPVGLEVLKDSTDTAATLVQSHPEMVNADATGSAYIKSSIIDGDSATKQSVNACAQTMEHYGMYIDPAASSDCGNTEYKQNSKGYGTNFPVCDENGEIAKNSYGDNQYVPIYQQAIASTSGSAMASGLTVAKDDTNLGANITTQTDPVPGLIWRNEDGVSTVDQTDNLNSNNRGDSSPGLDFTTPDKSPGHGFSCSVLEVDEALGLDAVITIRAKNWYSRFLGIYVRYLDGEGNPIKVSDLGFTQEQLETYFPLNGVYDTEYDLLVNLLGAKFEFLGIPCQTNAHADYKIPVPEMAVTARILASGMGNQSRNQNGVYGSTIPPGATMTGCFNLAIPFFFIVSNAAAGLATMSQDLEDYNTLITLFPLTMDLMASIAGSASFQDPKVFEQMGLQIGKALVKKGAGPLVNKIFGWEAKGEAEEDTLDAIPFVGAAMSAIYALGAAASIAQTSAEVANSPSTYVYDISLIHDIDVEVSPDPKDGGGNWPATATTLNVLLQFDGKGTPNTLVYNFPGTTVSGPITLKFPRMPLGGNVTASCTVLTETNILVGKGLLGPIPNVEQVKGEPLKIAFTIEELLIPLNKTTVYQHKELIKLDDNGNHVWEAASAPPYETQPSGCGLTDGQLCTLSGVAVNTTAGDVGYLWRSYNSQVTNCDSQATAEQLYQFANISASQDPQSGYFFSGCGFTTTPFIAYDLINTRNNNYYLDTTSTGPGYAGGIVRQIRLDGTNQGFDAPGSNRAFGKFRFESSAMLLHPAGQLISISANQNKFEVISLPFQAVPDEEAPFSQPYGGQGLRPGLMGGPTLAALAPDGSVLVLERDNNRIQAFDLNANPVPTFADGAYYIPLRQQDPDYSVTYLDMGVEFKGYIYVLYTLTPNIGNGDIQFVLDIYDPQGVFLASTPDFRAARLDVGYFRDIYTENFQVLKLPDGNIPGITEPSISHWIPVTGQ